MTGNAPLLVFPDEQDYQKDMVIFPEKNEKKQRPSFNSFAPSDCPFFYLNFHENFLRYSKL